MSLDKLIIALREQYGDVPPAKIRQRKRAAPLDEFLPQLSTYTMARVYAQNARNYTLARLADEIEARSGRRFCQSAIRKALIQHHLYQLWSR
jgi:hypothetical protein